MVRTVKSYTIAMHAYIAKGRLEAEGIPAYIADEHFVTLNWTISLAIGGVRVQVPLAYIEQAQQVISNLEQGEYETLDMHESLDDDLIQCPKCHSHETKPVDWLWKLSLVILILTHLPFPFSRHLHQCEKGHFLIAETEGGHPMYIHVFAFIFDLFLIIVIFNVIYYWGCKTYSCKPPF